MLCLSIFGFCRAQDLGLEVLGVGLEGGLG